MNARYLLITPCRDEAAYARRSLDSVVRQTVTPARWIIVDDGSTDDTPAILAEYAAKHPWIQVVRREDRGKRAVGPGVSDSRTQASPHCRNLVWDIPVCSSRNRQRGATGSCSKVNTVRKCAQSPWSAQVCTVSERS